MRRIAHAVVVAAVVSTTLTLLDPSARAQPTAPGPAPRGPLAQTLEGDARADYEAARLLFDDADFTGAATKYRRAYALSHDPRLLWNVAACEKGLRHYARASALVDQFLGDAASMLSAEQVASAVATRNALQALIRPVTFHVEPAGVHVFVDGQPLGDSPFPATVMVDLGAHRVHAEKPGFVAADRALGEQDARLDLALLAEDARGELIVHADVPEAAIAVDGHVLGTGRWQGRLAPGRHHVLVTASGKRTRSSDVDVVRGSRQSLDVALTDEGGSVWPWVAVGGSAAVVAGLVVGGYFLFRPSDTLGPAPVGSLGSAVIRARR